MTAALLTLGTRTFASVRRHRNYRLYATGQLVSMTGTWMQDIALPWLVFERTHSPVALGLLLACRYAPFALFGLFAGLTADRYDNRRFLIATQAAAMTVAAVLAVLTLAGTPPLEVVYALAFLGGAIFVLDLPNRQALTVQLVGRDELANAIALNSSVFHTARIVGPAVGGIVIAATGVGICFAVNAASFLAALAVLVVMRTGELYPLDRGETRPQGFRAIGEGISFVRNDPSLRVLFALAAVVALTGFNFRVVLPLLASDTLSAGAGVFGALLACNGAGALVGGLVAATAGTPSWRCILAAVGGLGATMVVLAPVHSISAAFALLVVLGFCLALSMTTGQSLVQLTAPDRLRGRVLSLYMLVLFGLALAGNLVAGWLTALGGTELVFLVGGVTAVLAAAAAVPRTLALPATARATRPTEVSEPTPVLDG
jgi:MFS family permease